MTIPTRDNERDGGTRKFYGRETRRYEKQEPSRDQREYYTQNLIIAAVLMYFKKEFLRITDSPLGGIIRKFIFTRDDEIPEIINKFHRGDILVEPREFNAMVRYLRTELRRYDNPAETPRALADKFSKIDVPQQEDD